MGAPLYLQIINLRPNAFLRLCRAHPLMVTARDNGDDIGTYAFLCCNSWVRSLNPQGLQPLGFTASSSLSRPHWAWNSDSPSLSRQSIFTSLKETALNHTADPSCDLRQFRFEVILSLAEWASLPCAGSLT